MQRLWLYLKVSSLHAVHENKYEQHTGSLFNLMTCSLLFLCSSRNKFLSSSCFITFCDFYIFFFSFSSFPSFSLEYEISLQKISSIFLLISGYRPIRSLTRHWFCSNSCFLNCSPHKIFVYPPKFLIYDVLCISMYSILFKEWQDIICGVMRNS